MENAIVYITTNLINGKKYIGSHNGNNPYYLGSGARLKYAIKKYGRDNFKRQTLWEGPGAYMREMEEYYIDYYNAKISPLFYNLTDKGTGWVKGQKRSEETIAKMSEARKGTPKPEGFGAKLAIVNKGKTRSEETKAKMSEDRKGRVFSEERNAKIREAMKGKNLGPRSEETKAKISASRKGIKYNKIKQTKEERKEYHKQYRLANKEKQREWYLKNREKAIETATKRYYKLKNNLERNRF